MDGVENEIWNWIKNYVELCTGKITQILFKT